MNEMVFEKRKVSDIPGLENAIGGGTPELHLDIGEACMIIVMPEPTQEVWRPNPMDPQKPEAMVGIIVEDPQKNRAILAAKLGTPANRDLVSVYEKFAGKMIWIGKVLETPESTDARIVAVAVHQTPAKPGPHLDAVNATVAPSNPAPEPKPPEKAGKKKDPAKTQPTTKIDAPLPPPPDPSAKTGEEECKSSMRTWIIFADGQLTKLGQVGDYRKGVPYEVLKHQIVCESGVPEGKADAVIKAMLDEGIAFEPKSGILKIVAKGESK